MKSITPIRLITIVVATLAFSPFTHAHSGSSLAYDCAAGVAHPFHGWDHLAAMLAVGVWAAQLGGRARWLVPAAFVTVMTCATVLGSRGWVLPGFEPMIATSVLALGVLIATAVPVRLATSVTLVSFFALAHGFAHGAEIPANVVPVSYAAGFVLATAALHVLGLGIGHLALRRSPYLSRVLGAVCAAAGTALLLA